MSQRIVYEVQRPDGKWTSKMSRSAVAAVAAKRLIAGHGRFTIIAEFRKPTSHHAPELKRKDALTTLWRTMGEMKGGDDLRVHDGKGNGVLHVRALWAMDPRRDEMVKWARWGTQHAGSIHYSQVRPYRHYAPGTLPMTLDCSSSTITYARWAGAPDPSGFGFSGAGNTDSIYRHLRKRQRISDAELGDLILWHNGLDGKHVAVVVGRGRDPLLASHGSENGPLLIRYSAEYRYHSGETATALDLLS